MKMYLLWLVMVFGLKIAWSDAAVAHEDTQIQLKSGALIGLPEKYAPAEFDLKSSRIRIGNHAMTFPPLLKGLFDHPHDLEISASWYHRPEILPPYILIRIRPTRKDFGYEVLLNLDTLELIQLSVVLQESKSSSRTLPIDVGDRLKVDIRKSIQTLK